MSPNKTDLYRIAVSFVLGLLAGQTLLHLSPSSPNDTRGPQTDLDPTHHTTDLNLDLAPNRPRDPGADLDPHHSLVTEIGAKNLTWIPADVLEEWTTQPWTTCPSTFPPPGRNSTAAGLEQLIRTPHACYCGVWAFYARFYVEFSRSSAAEHVRGLLRRGLAPSSALTDDARGRLGRRGRGRRSRAEGGVEGAAARGDPSSLSSSSSSSSEIDESIIPARDAMVIEVGARRGAMADYWEFVTSHTPGKPSVVLVEPNPDYREALVAATQRLKGLTLVYEAMYDRIAEFPFLTPERAGSLPSAFSRIFLGEKDRLGPHVTVKASTLDVLFDTTLSKIIPAASISTSARAPETLPIYILDTSTSGFDFAILNGARKVLPHVRFLFFACDILSRKDHDGPGITHDEIQKLLSSVGFVAFKTHPMQFVPFTDKFYNPLVDHMQHMGFQECVAFRRDDPFLGTIMQHFNIFSGCELAD
eukprot:TRINITY_DN5434_c0_g2_i1.p1 TRINITY_DN5434_c0_g2~~TRINITY_DN5434_c0_g2_i1.p1  ORF type:complete len:473 (-),score=69.34 TRINITY_DN5434_c0_g2_i1:75-1493(-)